MKIVHLLTNKTNQALHDQKASVINAFAPRKGTPRSGNRKTPYIAVHVCRQHNDKDWYCEYASCSWVLERDESW